MSRSTARSFCLGLLAAGSALLLCGALAASPAGADSRGADEPRLRLAVDRPVREGQRLTLHWEGADASIEELEILLSVDGGRTYSISVSPSLDPRTGRYEWIVPKLGGTQPWLRIRFNRGGREIEGRPTRLETFLAHGCDLPESAVLPRDAEPEGSHGPGQSEGGIPSGAAHSGVGSCEPAGETGRARPLALSATLGAGASEAVARSTAALARDSFGATAPRFIPPRR